MVRDYDSETIPAVYNVDEDIPERDVRKGVSQKMFRGMNISMSWVTIEPDMDTRPHAHPWEQIVYVVDGTIEWHVGDESFTASAGDVFFIPPNVEHYEVANSDEPCLMMDIWLVREDYTNLTDYQEEFPTGESE